MKWPLTTNSHLQRLVGKSCYFGPFLQGHGAFIPRQQDGDASVSILSRSHYPSNISGLVIQIIVDSIDAVLRCWTWSNVSEKVGVGPSPAIAYGYATSTPIFVARSIGVRATLDHFSPAVVFGCSFHGRKYNNIRLALRERAR
jgi:hypothetical protein